ncbi:hypothetical protein [Nocardioides houyundeii]|uniref:hypothetical protein n=1 Tax=Nocardioides houyundeii TaxID=2045452 RepID=UPI000DF2D0E1|nr:hypothetical protein [Nocardioides houyundeii]
MSDALGEIVDQLAEALREDPVLVDPVFGNGRTDEVHEALGDVVDGLGFPAYVVMVPRPPGLSANDPDRELATLLHEEIGGAGLYAVMTDPVGYGETLAGFGAVPDPSARFGIELGLYPDGGADADLSAAGVVARELDLVAALDAGVPVSQQQFETYAEQAVWRDPPEWDQEYEVPTTGAYAVFTTMAFVAVAGCAWLVLRNLARWRETAPETRQPGLATGPAPRGEGPAQVRARAEAELDDLAQQLAATAGTAQPDDVRVLVDGSYDTARAVLERTGSNAEDLDDLVGALVLTRVAGRALTARRRRTTPYRPCFFDPRHGEGVRERTVPVGDRELTVPACGTCGQTGGQADDQAHDQAPRPMLLPGGLLGRERPWYELDTVWARTGYGAFVDDLWDHVATELRSAR